MCEYCKKQDDIGNIPKILSTCIPLGAIGKNRAEVYVKDNTLMIYHYIANQSVIAESEVKTPIKYCPMCGKELT